MVRPTAMWVSVARQVNRALAEIGLQHHSILGWELTEFGRSLGGKQEESANSGAFYVTWPHEIVDHPVIHRELSRQSDQSYASSEPVATGGGASEPDLFAGLEEPEKPLCGIDGHPVESPLQLQVCNWLYLAQLPHAYRRALPVEEPVIADFYLPVGNVYIDCARSRTTAESLSDMMRRRVLYRELGLRSIEIEVADAERLDEVLGRGLLAWGIRC